MEPKKWATELLEKWRVLQHLRTKIQPHNLHLTFLQLENCQVWKSSTQPLFLH